jgi:hypothetical protein
MPILNTFTSAAARAFKSVVSSVIDPFFSSVGLLLHGDLFGTTNQNDTFLDSSSFALSTSAVNGKPIQGAFTPFYSSGVYDPATQGGSCYFNGTTDYFQYATSSSWAFGTGDFTIEFYAYIGANNNSSTSGILCSRVLNSSVAGTWSLSIGKNFIYFGEARAGGAFTSYSGTVNDLVWNHFAIVRNAGVVSLYLNGVSVASSANTTNFNTTYPLYVGTVNTSPLQIYNGYMANLRIVKGTAVYTSNFTPPTSPVANITGTGLLLNFANAAAYDASAKTNVATAGNAAVSSVQKKFGTGSLYLDGTASSFQYLEQGATAVGSGDFTFETWAYKSGSSGNFGRIITAQSFFIQDGVIGLRFFFAGNQLFSAGQLPFNTWKNIALTRQGNTFRGFVDGVLIGTTTLSSTTTATGTAYIGTDISGSGEIFVGYLDEIRITKGVARYTSNFTPPTAPFPNS